MRTDVEYQGFSAEEGAYLEARMREEYAEAYTHGLLLLSEDVTRAISLALDLAEFAAKFVPYATPLLLLKVIKEGKAVNEGMEGWVSAYHKLLPERSKKLSSFKESMERKAGAKIRLSVGANLSASDKRIVPLFPPRDGDPDDVAFLLVCLAEALQRAVNETESKGYSFASNILFHFRGDSFGFRWHNIDPSTDYRAFFDLEGRMIGDPIEDFEPVEEFLASAAFVAQPFNAPSAQLEGQQS